MSQPTTQPRLSRRGFLGLGAGLAGLAVAPNLVLPRRLDQFFVSGDAFGEATVRSSVDGILDTQLRASFGPTWVQGRPGRMMSYEGGCPGPTLRVRGGDLLRIRLVNDLDTPTNLHVHGLHVSPLNNGDNIFLHVMPGESFVYEYKIPDNHPAGLYWYHPHMHGKSEDQVFGGLAGGIIIEGELDRVPGIAGLPERTLLLQTTQLDAANNLVPNEKSEHDQFVRLVNGQLNPTMSIRPGEVQRWRIGNLSADTFYQIHLEGHTLYEINSDGNPLAEVNPTDEILVAPAARTEVLIVGGPPGTYHLRTLFFDQGNDKEPDTVIATLVSAGQVQVPAALPTSLVPFVDLSQAPIDRFRTLAFSFLPGPNFEAAINGQLFDPNRVDQFVPLGSTEEWLLYNQTDEWHPFHIHINPFQVVAVNGQPVPVLSPQDTVGIPPNGNLTVRMRFVDFPGKWVYHCHILGHEDAGMMGVIEVASLPGEFMRQTLADPYNCDLI